VVEKRSAVLEGYQTPLLSVVVGIAGWAEPLTRRVVEFRPAPGRPADYQHPAVRERRRQRRNELVGSVARQAEPPCVGIVDFCGPSGLTLVVAGHNENLAVREQHGRRRLPFFAHRPRLSERAATRDVGCRGDEAAGRRGDLGRG